MAIKFYESPFHAIEEPEVASKSVLKADLTIMIRDIIENRGLTQKEAAERLPVTQPRVSDIVNGKIDTALCARITDNKKRGKINL
jgi:predicted XRE-type DNA-binding protein